MLTNHSIWVGPPYALKSEPHGPCDAVPLQGAGNVQLATLLSLALPHIPNGALAPVKAIPYGNDEPFIWLNELFAKV